MRSDGRISQASFSNLPENYLERLIAMEERIKKAPKYVSGTRRTDGTAMQISRPGHTERYVILRFYLRTLRHHGINLRGPDKINETEQLCPTCEKKLRRKYSSPAIKVAFQSRA